MSSKLLLRCSAFLLGIFAWGSLATDIFGQSTAALQLKDSLIFYIGKGKLELAVPFAKQRAEVLKAELGEHSVEYASGLNTWGDLLSRLGKIKEAEVILLEGMRIWQDLAQTRDLNLALPNNTLGILYLNAGDFAQSQVYFEKALYWRKLQIPEDTPALATVYDNLGSVCAQNGELKRAELFLKQGLQLRKKKFGEWHLFVATSENNLANFYKWIGDYAKSKTGYENALKIYTKNALEASPTYALYLNNLGSILRIMGQPDSALILARQSLDMRQKRLGPNHPDVSVSFNSIGAIFADKQEYYLALDHFEKSLTVLLHNGTASHPDVWETKTNMALIWFKLKIYSKADSIFKSVWMESQNHFSAGNPKLNALITGYAQTAVALGNYNLADSLFILLGNHHRLQVNQYLPFLTEFEREKFVQNLEKGRAIFQSYCAKRGQQNGRLFSQLFEHQLATKGILLSNYRELKQWIASQKDTSIQAKARQWQSLKQKIARAKTSMLPGEETNLNRWLREAEELEKTLSISATDFSQTTGAKPINLKAIAGNLKNGEAAVELIRVKNPDYIFEPKTETQLAADSIWYVALCLEKGQKSPVAALLKNGSELEGRWLSYYSKNLKFVAEDQYGYKQFWERIARKIDKKVKRLYLVADGVYHLVNVETLFNPQSKAYVMDEVEIRYLPTLKLLTNQKSVPSPASGLAVLVGNPYFDYQEKSPNADNTTVSGQKQMETFGQLPGTQAEVKKIADVLAKHQIPVQLLTEELATEANLKKVASPIMLHIATHGFYNKETSPNTFEKRQAGLALAGANYGGNEQEDGLLTVPEAKELNLEKTSLVVLSACETGLGQLHEGEGVYGLARSCSEAGAATVIMSLWRVDDQATQLLMTNFYQNWLGPPDTKYHAASARFAQPGKGNSSAMRQAFTAAQKEIRAKFPEPYFWGAFVMLGM